MPARDLEHEQAIREARRGLDRPRLSPPAYYGPRSGGIASRARELARRNAYDKRKYGQK